MMPAGVVRREFETIPSSAGAADFFVGQTDRRVDVSFATNRRYAGNGRSAGEALCCGLTFTRRLPSTEAGIQRGSSVFSVQTGLTEEDLRVPAEVVLTQARLCGVACSSPRIRLRLGKKLSLPTSPA